MPPIPLLHIYDPDGKHVFVNLDDVSHIDFDVQRAEEGREIVLFGIHFADGRQLARAVHGRPAKELLWVLTNWRAVVIGGPKGVPSNG